MKRTLSVRALKRFKWMLGVSSVYLLLIGSYNMATAQTDDVANLEYGGPY